MITEMYEGSAQCSGSAMSRGNSTQIPLMDSHAPIPNKMDKTATRGWASLHPIFGFPSICS